ncbi:hypothetical protein GGS23DRAFT_414036 [Durotheca rogersii]|uniref:uncharacterized protein n=1 Tax=Durotheca rogersii TaxID=419775 RepID=UPI00221F0EC2|nr:uncharacterized protein GGS23DRAFT_414036 [Durotheca rogersii]KAI5865194.1 hypothetical protein GGS23DRAFT_414036 [Durotheca rogersii]
MSSERGPDTIDARVVQTLSRQFPDWHDTPNDGSVKSFSAGKDCAEFLLASNWILRPQGIKHFFTELQEHTKGVQVTYDLDTASAKIRCSTSDEKAVMEASQLIMDRMASGEIADGLVSGEKITPSKKSRAGISNQKSRNMCAAALFPEDIRGFAFQTAWTLPDNQIMSGTRMGEFIPGKQLSQLRDITGCTMIIGNDEPVMYIGADSLEKIAVAERKLNTMAKYSVRLPGVEAICENFVYTEDEQGNNCTFTRLDDGNRSHLRTFLLDRSKYRLTRDYSAYSRISRGVVVVSLVRDESGQVISKPAFIQPAISRDDRGKPYAAFSKPTGWNYQSKPRHVAMEPGDTPSPEIVTFRHASNSHVTSWVRQLPAPKLMLSHEEASKPPQPDPAFAPSQHEPSNSASRRNSGIVSTRGSSRGISRSGEEGGRKVSEARNPAPKQYPESDQRGEITSRGNGADRRQAETGRKPARRLDANSSHSSRRGHYSRITQQRRPSTRPDTDRTVKGNQQTVRATPLPQRDSVSSGRAQPHAPVSSKDERLRYRHDGGPHNHSVPSPQVGQLIPIGSDSDEAGDVDESKESEEGVDKMSEEIARLKLGEEKQAQEPQLRKQDRERAVLSGTDELVQEPLSQPTQAKQTPEDPFMALFNTARLRVGLSRTMGEEGSPIFRSTMRQQAGSRPIPGSASQGRPGVEPRGPGTSFVETINEKLINIMNTLRLYAGNVTLKAELGRLCATRVDTNLVQRQDRQSGDQVKSLQVIKEVLDKSHVKPRDIMFTNILTTEGADADYLARITNQFGDKIWSSVSRHTVYEVYCYAQATDGRPYRFAVEIDGRGFTSQVKPIVPEPDFLFIHCPKRSWDFQITLKKCKDLGKQYRNFADDLVDCMQVIPQKTGIPILEFLIKRPWQVEILLARTRNIAEYKKLSSNASSCILEISEIHDMKPTAVTHTESDKTIKFEQYAGNRALGHPPTWYEAAVRSTIVEDALMQNQNLEFGDEVTWSSKQLREVGAFTDMVSSATEMVQNMDGVGYWNDNLQDTKADDSSHPVDSSLSETIIW